MQKNKLVISIDRPIAEVFEFTINPDNTPRWIEHLVVEEASDYPPKLGTVYRNKDKAGVWSQYSVTALEQNNTFELTSDDGNYHVRYSYTEPANDHTQMVYLEWVDQGELDNPFTESILAKLKYAIEERACK